jgi:hypothetical protein
LLAKQNTTMQNTIHCNSLTKRSSSTLSQYSAAPGYCHTITSDALLLRNITLRYHDLTQLSPTDTAPSSTIRRYNITLHCPAETKLDDSGLLHCPALLHSMPCQTKPHVVLALLNITHHCRSSADLYITKTSLHWTLQRQYGTLLNFCNTTCCCNYTLQ